MQLSKEIISAISKLGTVKLNAGMKDYTTFKTGGCCDMLVIPKGNIEISSIISIAKSNNIPVTVIGGGSNILIGDKGIKGIVIRMLEDEVLTGEIEIKDGGSVYASAMVSKENFINHLLNAGYEGFEFMAGIPGSIGGGIVMNAGTSERCFRDVLESIDVIQSDVVSRKIDVNDNMYSYRKLIISKEAIVTGGYFRFKKAIEIDNIKKKIDAILSERREKHPLDYPSAGSVFKNPKGFSSWLLIDNAGLKGRSVGGAMISEKHTNFIINSDNATSRDIKDLIELVREKVNNRFNVMLETEIRLLGDF